MPSIPRVCIKTVRLCVLAAEAHGFDPQQILREHGLTAPLLGDVYARVPHSVAHRLWREIPARTGDGAFGLHTAERWHAETLDAFNFFPAQPYLFEKTFPIWALFNVFQGREGGECNQLVAVDSADRLQVQGMDEIVQVNLNRFSSLIGYFDSVQEVGRHTFTVDPDYLWYGMLMRKV